MIESPLSIAPDGLFCSQPFGIRCSNPLVLMTCAVESNMPNLPDGNPCEAIHSK
jgi:hypothetical protein